MARLLLLLCYGVMFCVNAMLLFLGIVKTVQGLVLIANGV